MKKNRKKLEVVMLSSVDKFGQKGDKIEVAKGYAINYLIPKKMAILSSDPRAMVILREAEKEKEKRQREIEEINQIAQRIDGLKIEIQGKAGQTGKLFGSVTKKDVLKEIEKSAKVKLEKAEIIGDLPIKKIGDYKLKIKLATGIESEINLKVSGINKNKK